MDFFRVSRTTSAIIEEDTILPGEEKTPTMNSIDSVPSMTTTENGALAHNGTGDACLDLFIKSVRGLTGIDLETRMLAAWNENPETMLQIVYNNRDCRGGKGERALFFEMAIWLRRNHWKTYKLNLNNLIQLGRFKDLIDISVLAFDDCLENKYYELQQLANYLVTDYLRFMTDKKDITLCAKWCPTRDNDATRKHKLTKHFINILFDADNSHLNYPDEWKSVVSGWKKKYGEGNTNEIYRKEVLVPLRKHIGIVESLMTSGNWTGIKLPQVPAKAMAKYRKAFAKHIPEMLNEYLEKLKTGATKINTTGQTPYDIVHANYMNFNYSGFQEDDVLEAQWNDMVAKSKAANQLTRTVSVVDVSGSMGGTPLEVAIALGLFTSLLPDETDPFYRRLITFSEQPAFHSVVGDNLSSMLNSVHHMNWGMNTDFNAVFRLILDTGKQLELTQEQMPKRVIVYTDMEFDAAQSRTKTNFQEITSMYAKSGYVMPQMVFWNLRASSNNAMPVTKDENGCAFLSGYSAELLKGLMDGEIDPIKIMMNVLGKYNVIVAPEDLVTE